MSLPAVFTSEITGIFTMPVPSHSLCVHMPHKSNVIKDFPVADSGYKTEPFEDIEYLHSHHIISKIHSVWPSSTLLPTYNFMRIFS